MASAQDSLLEITDIQYISLEEKLTALNAGSILLLKHFELGSNKDLLLRIEGDIAQISYECHLPQGKTADQRYWTIYNVGINDLSYTQVFLFDQVAYDYNNLFNKGDIIIYQNSGVEDSAIVTNVYYDNTTLGFAYKISREPDLFDENQLTHL